MLDKQKITFTSHLVPFSFELAEKHVSVLNVLISDYNLDLDYMHYIFCSDEYVLELNKKHLEHDYYTDILTFPYQTNPIQSDIFISIERVKENASSYGVHFEEELSRVIFHGALHLAGLNDATKEDKEHMRSEENRYIEMLLNSKV